MTSPPAHGASRPRALLSIVGTRPEAIKMAPVARSLARLPGTRHEILLTGQHGGLESHFDGGGNLGRLRFDPGGQCVESVRESLRSRLRGRFRRRPADLVLVQGDTTSAFAGALAARDCAIPVAHVEAGLRSFDLARPWPEEGHRVAIDSLAALLFAPTESAAGNLRREPGVNGRILVTGNSGIDALLAARDRIAHAAPPAPGERRPILVTCHRHENRGAPARSVCGAIRDIVARLPVRVTVALHPNPAARETVERALAGADHVDLLDPQDHEAMVRLMVSSWLILTDSGGLQEEAPALGRPLLVLRDVTERPEALATGNVVLVGTDPGRIFAAVASLLADEALYARMARPAFPFGDGRASERIAAAVGEWLAERD